MAMEGGVVEGRQAEQPAQPVERLNQAVQQQLNLESVKTRAISLFKAVSRILDEFDAIARANTLPKWQDVLSQFSMVNLELFNIVEDIKKVSKAFVVHPKNVNAQNATILPVMLSSKLLPEMETEDNLKREQLLHGMQNLQLLSQIDKLKTRIDLIGAACESAEKVIADTRKAYFGTRQGPSLLPTLDKVQAAKIQEQESLLRSAVNQGEGYITELGYGCGSKCGILSFKKFRIHEHEYEVGDKCSSAETLHVNSTLKISYSIFQTHWDSVLAICLRIPGDQRQITSALPMHLVDDLDVGESSQTFADGSGERKNMT